MIQFGNDKIKEIYHGSDKIKEVYYGLELVWSSFKPSYMILTNDTRIDFEIENTPIANFCRSSYDMAINGFSYSKNAIKEIHFGSSYSGLAEIGMIFLYNCTSLTDLTLNFPALNSVGASFLRQCTSLTVITLTTKTPPNTNSSYFLNGTSKLSSIYVPPVSVQAYKTTSPWSIKSSLIKAI